VGLTVLDAGVVIGFLDGADPHHERARAALGDAGQRGDSLLLPVSAFAECLVGPARRGDAAITAVREFVARLPITIVPLDAAIAEAAARLRARHGGRLRLPDALVVATALVLDADRLLTTDRRWPRRASLGLRGQLLQV
jgi:predicted nucleic acid-binding protein